MKYLLLTFFLSVSALAEVAPPHIGPEGGRFNKIHALKIEKLIKAKLEDKENTASEQIRKGTFTASPIKKY